MPRLRRYLPPLLLLLPVIFICGKLLLTPVHPMLYPPDMPPMEMEEYVRGWPWVFIDVDYIALPPSTKPTHVVQEFSLLLLLADFAVLTVPIALAWLIIVWLQRRSNGWRQFSIRGLLVFVTLVAGACGWWMSRTNQSKYEMQLIRKLKANSKTIYLPQRDNFAPQWVRRFIRDDRFLAFHQIVTLYAHVPADQSTFPDELIDALPQLSRLRTLAIWNRIEDEKSPERRLPLRIDQPAALEQLENIVFSETADDQTLFAIASLPNLRRLEVLSCPVTDAGLASIGKCKSLESLQVKDCPSVTAAGLVHLANLNQLAYLSVDQLEIDSAAMDSILRIKSLQTIHLSKVKISDELARRLVELPNLQSIQIEDPRSELSDEAQTFLKDRIPSVSIQRLEED